MNTPPDETPRKKGILDSAKNYAANALGATRAKVDDFGAEVEYRSLRILWMVVWSIVGVVSACLGITFAMLTVIFGFHLPPKYAFGIPAVVFLLVGMASLLMFLRAKHTRRRTRPAR
ncbi:MAG TPA: phage holin family protein [Candidatus Krumholzibacteria bacterium]|nr:phage holin family protein [Candidatus Krumholzibacteria bacterium]